ncbi:unnamed protein product [Paramecium primaurelia]|uniref:Uncharacterized protein n=1 Tax=Paramecium primaurelia TaxID=5886 RepID=A0A8S1QSW6_PARPR|nr:unnamed protein product [Paramecium primaurelia]
MIQEMQKCSQKDENYQNQMNLIKEIQELIDQAKKYQCQSNLFNQTIMVYQQHVENIEYFKQNIQTKSQDLTVKSEQLKSQFSKLSNILKEYGNTFENNSIQLKKYCNIKQLEDEIIKLKETNTNLENESNALQSQIENNFISSKQQDYEEKLKETNEKLLLKENELKDLKEQHQQIILDNNNLKKQYELDKTMMIKKFEDEQNKVKQEFNQNLTQKKQELQEALNKLDQINKVKFEQEKQKKIELEKIQLYSKSLLFSNTYKHTNCQVSEGGKVVAEVSNNGWFFCLCEQAIPKTGKIQFAFQMINGSTFMVGIGYREIMQKNNYHNCYKTGTYLIVQDGYTYSHNNKDQYEKRLSFGFTNNDIIIIEISIEHKYIKWSRQNNPQATFVLLDIDVSQELYPCVGVVNQSKIKLLDNIPF